MKIQDIILKVEHINNDYQTDKSYYEYLTVGVKVITDDCETVTGFSDIGSWRGDYSEPCLFTGGLCSSRDLLRELYFCASGNPSEGYKGGVFRYGMHDFLYVESAPREYTSDAYITEVVYDDDSHRILLICDKREGERC